MPCWQRLVFTTTPATTSSLVQHVENISVSQHWASLIQVSVELLPRRACRLFEPSSHIPSAWLLTVQNMLFCCFISFWVAVYFITRGSPFVVCFCTDNFKHHKLNHLIFHETLSHINWWHCAFGLVAVIMRLKGHVLGTQHSEVRRLLWLLSVCPFFTFASLAEMASDMVICFFHNVECCH